MFQTNNQILSRKMMIFPKPDSCAKGWFPAFFTAWVSSAIVRFRTGKKDLVDISQPTWTCIPVSKWFIIHIYIYIIHIYIYIYIHTYPCIYIYIPHLFPYISGDMPYITGVQLGVEPIFEVKCTPSRDGVHCDDIHSVWCRWLEFKWWT